MERASFAAGCFWGIEEEFRKRKGVLDTAVGYSGGHIADPTYEQVCSGNTGHAETVEVTYDPDLISYNELLATFWNIHDPTILNRQGLDIGTQYRSVIFYHTENQHQLAKTSAQEQEKELGKPVVTEIKPAGPFYRAEEYHQCYLKKQQDL